jgi:tRNA pseudouridine55 synthase
LARRETYRSKNKDIIEAGQAFVPRRGKVVKIDAAIQQPFVEGKLILIDKPQHWTSFDVIHKLRELLQIRKIGHAGTLDPLATGLLIICTGRFTKNINEYMALEKQYSGQFTLGAVTPTYDLESKPEQPKDYSFITHELLQNATNNFIGPIEQLPPMHSAIKRDGVPLYKSARKGEEIQLTPRKITISDFTITKIALPIVEFTVTCSTGTYIRSLAHDFGQALGCGAYLSGLRRTKIGAFDVSKSLTISAFEESLTKL